jgi:hypothetical protein
VDDQFGEAGSVLAGQAPSPQLMGSSEATYLVLWAASEYRSSRMVAKVFILLFSRVSLINTDRSTA